MPRALTPSKKRPDLSWAPCVRGGPAVPWRAAVQAVWVVVVVLVAHAVYLARSLSQTRVRLLSLERFARVPVGIDDLESKRAADLERLAAVEQAQAPAPAPAAAPAVSGTEPDDDDACTKVWTGPPAALVEAAARGANPPSEATPRAVFSMDVAPRAAASPPPISSAAPQATPRAFLSMNVAPRAVALVPPLSRVAQLAAGLERPKSTRSPPHAPPVPCAYRNARGDGLAVPSRDFRGRRLGRAPLVAELETARKRGQHAPAGRPGAGRRYPPLSPNAALHAGAKHTAARGPHAARCGRGGCEAEQRPERRNYGARSATDVRAP